MLPWQNSTYSPVPYNKKTDCTSLDSSGVAGFPWEEWRCLFRHLWGFLENVQPFIPCLCFFFFQVEISSCTLISLFRPGPVHSGSASRDDQQQLNALNSRLWQSSEMFVFNIWASREKNGMAIDESHLHLNTQASLIQQSQSRLTMLSRHSAGTYQGKQVHTQLIRKNSATVISSHWATVAWSWLEKKMELVYTSWSPFKKKKRPGGEWIIKPSPQILASEESTSIKVGWWAKRPSHKWLASQ